MSWSCECGQTIGSDKVEHCVGCHQTFMNTPSGDAHRVGRMDNRRCLTPEQMLRRKKPFHQNAYGYWTQGDK